MIFLITYEVTSGESEYISVHTVKARNTSEAERRALKYISQFFAVGTHPDDDEPSRFWSDDDAEYIELVEIEEVTPEQLVEKLSIN
jgi:hypothetical protein